MSDFTDSEEVGVIVAGSSSYELIFVSDKDNYPLVHDYVCFSSVENYQGEDIKVEVLARVSNVVMNSEIINKDVDPSHVSKLLSYSLDETKVLGRAKIIGYLLPGEKEPQMPRRAPLPGTKLKRASSKLLQEFLSFGEEEGLYVGNLAVRPDVKIRINLNGLRRHLAIIAQTGAGKTYLSGVLMEELLKKGATILVIDPHADYVFLGLKPDGSPSEFKEKVSIFRNPSSAGRYGEKEIGMKFKDLTIRLSELKTEELLELLRVSYHYVNIRNVIKNAIEEVQKENKVITLVSLREKLERFSSNPDISKEERKAAAQAIKRIKELESYRIFGESSFHFEDIVCEGKATILDLSGMDIESQDFITYLTLRYLLHKAQVGDLGFPLFVFIEEAHNFIPSDEKSFSSKIINKIAAEGRKFGIFLVLITQRPSRVSSNALSQCNSQIVMRITNPRDQEAIINSSERLSEEELQDLPGLNTGEAVIVGEVVRVPVMIKVRKRETKEGGSDIDIVKRLKAFREEELLRAERIKIGRFSGSFSED